MPNPIKNIFVFDVNAIARLYFSDIGHKNLVHIFNLPDSLFYTITISKIELRSALIKSCSERPAPLNKSDVTKIMTKFYFDLSRNKIIMLESEPLIGSSITHTLINNYASSGQTSFNAVDALYLSCCLLLRKQFKTTPKVVFVTSDRKLYNAAEKEKSIDAFNFWTCNLGNPYVNEFLPQKGKGVISEKKFKCPSCKSETILRHSKPSPNSDGATGASCAICHITNCPSTFIPTF